MIAKKGIGHHPHSLEDPGPIVDFILRNTINEHKMNYLHLLSTIESADQFGGKAANLAQLQRWGYQVPKTIVIKQEALKQFLVQNDLEGMIKAYINNGIQTEMATAYESIIDIMSQAVMPDELQIEIREAADRLLQTSPFGLAARSSAIFEDSERASFAGVFESYLGLKTADEVIKKVLACWCSAWSPRALRYMNRMGIEPAIDGMAVILQEVIPASSSGVIYTADPRTGNPWHFALEATRGLSVDLMSGSGVGDSFRLDWQSGYILERNIVTKPKEIKAANEGLQEIINRTDAPSAPALTDREAMKITHLARELDERFGFRLDIEWAFTPEGIYVLQARPMTAIPVFFPTKLTAEQEQRSWKSAMAVLPLRTDQSAHLLTPLYQHYSECEMWHRYQPKDIVLTSICQEELSVNGHRFWEADEQPTFQNFFDSPGEYEGWIEKNEQRYRQRWDHYRTELEEIKATTTKGLAEATNYAELIPVLLEVMDQLWDLNSFGWSGPQALGWMCEAALSHFLQEQGVEVDTASLLAGNSNSFTFRSTRAQQELGRSIREQAVMEAFEQLDLDEVIPHLIQTAPEEDFLKQFETFCWNFGKTPSSWKNRSAIWGGSNQDTQLISAIKNAYLGKSRDVEKLQEDSLKKQKQQEQNIRDKLDKLGEEARERFDRLLEWARYWGQALNDRHELNVGLLYERELLWQVGGLLVSEELLEREEDILVLKRADLEVIAQTGDPYLIKSTYRERLKTFHRNRRLRSPAFLGKAPEGEKKETPPSKNEESLEDTDGVFTGQGFGGGVAIGKAKKVTDLSDATLLESLNEEDILVLPHETAFHYADWHSILTMVKAVVSPGRPSHHLAQVARECGVPLVGHLTGDLKVIPEGAEIRVDGTNGRVRVSL